MAIINDEKVFFVPGDLCQVKHDLPMKPTMYVVEKLTRSMVSKDGEKSSVFIGIKCRWFDINMVLREAVFSTKDLIHVE